MPMRGVQRFGVSGKLRPRYVGPFEILERVRSLAYRLALSPQPAHVHDVFHVSMLRKYVADPSHVINYHPLVVQEDASYTELLASIVDQKEKMPHNRTIPYVKIQWQRHTLEEATWELEEDIRRLHSHLFA
ncbi:uncharacterized protein LOC127812744 [Diospyros lotus]|uniref:uncharacterized protein LOC127812744 n=1 Tax=Diospyros lotus TaxID=55363 RepID=UPI0022546F44|nr:uncharacterized protein LOC127812744 [Diospyros lotus]